jgi:hypothetical protein
MSADLDIIIVNYNTRDLLADCLASLFAAPPVRLREVVVVDNASTDGTVAAVQTRWPAVRVIALDRNVGFGAANNVALKASRADLVLLLNSDTTVPPGAIDTLVERLEATGAAVAGPCLLDVLGRPELSFGPMLTPFGELRQVVRGRLAASRRAFARRRTMRLLSVERMVDWVTGACLLARRDRLEAAGFFDERYFLYEEDVDLCAAIRRQGGRVLFTPAAHVTHLRGGSVRRAGAARSRAYDRSHVAFYEKHAPAWVPLLRLSLVLRGRRIR